MKTESNRFYIPKTITVGYQKRDDTYTGKLAYIIYTDEKGVLRKEASWNSWRSYAIEPETFDNTPTSGFVLNKHVGGCKSGWNVRQSYCRVYDPRGFEFEITMKNLLFILENCNCMVGKGLDGQFVYSWQETELVLMPVNTELYKQAYDYTAIISDHKTFTADDLEVGDIYKDKNDICYIYLGSYDLYYANEQRRDYAFGTNRGKHFYYCTVPADFLNIESPDDLQIDNYHIGNYKYKIIHQKSIGKKFIQKLDYKYPFTDLLLQCLYHMPEYSPVKRVEIRAFTKEEFKKHISRVDSLYSDSIINPNNLNDDNISCGYCQWTEQYLANILDRYEGKVFDNADDAVDYVYQNITPAYAYMYLENGNLWQSTGHAFEVRRYKDYVQYE